MAEPLPPHAHSPLPLAGSLTNGGSPLPLVAHAASQYMQLAVTIETARISHCSGGLTQLLKPSPYAELSVDGKPPKRTDICKSSTHPKWQAELSVIVTPHSRLSFRVYDHSTFKKDALLASAALDLYAVLRQNNGRLHDLELALDLKKNSMAGAEANGVDLHGGTDVMNAGILYVKLNGAQVDMSRTLPPPASASAVGYTSAAVIATSSSPEDGVLGATSSNPSSLSTR